MQIQLMVYCQNINYLRGLKSMSEKIEINVETKDQLQRYSTLRLFLGNKQKISKQPVKMIIAVT